MSPPVAPSAFMVPITSRLRAIWLATALAVANVSLAGVFLVEPWLFGRVVDALAAKVSADAWVYIAWWTGVGFFGVAANALVALYSDRLAHRSSPRRPLRKS